MVNAVVSNSTIRDNLLACRLALWHTPGIGPVSFEEIENQFSDLRELFSLSSSELKLHGLSDNLVKQVNNPDWQNVEEDLLWTQQPNHSILCKDDPNYPALLKQIASAPPILYVQGDAALLSTPQIAMVGSRNPSHLGREIAMQFAEELSSSGYCITSGLALGIDSASHQGALKQGGKTIAVLGTGFDCIYPRSHKDLAETIASQGALVSEFQRSAQPIAQHFPQRNRIISGLSLGVLVVEAALKSGSLITARYAIEQNREVFAIPGSIHNPLARGCHELIRNGAKLVDSAQHVFEELNPLISYVIEQKNSKKLPEGLDKQHLNLVKCIDSDVTAVDLVLARSGLSHQKLAPLLLDLELKGVIIQVPGGYIKA